MVLAQASRSTSLAPWLWVLLALVVAQVIVIAMVGPVRRRSARREPDDASPPPRTTPLAALAGRSDHEIAPHPGSRAAPSPDWAAVERDLAARVGPAVQGLVDALDGEPIGEPLVRELAEDLARSVARAHGLDEEQARVLGRTLGNQLVDVVVAAPAA